MAAAKIPSTMRAAQWSVAPMESSLRLNNAVPVPVQGKPLPKNAALVKVAYASLNPVDYKVPDFRLARLTMLGKAPWIPGCDFAGTVVETTLSHVKPGDRVFGYLNLPAFGTLAEYVIVEGAENVAKVPDGVGLEDAAALGVAAQTALQAIAPFVEKDSKVLINGGSGGTGMFEIQFAKLHGCEVTAICSGANVEFCKSLGADHVIDYRAVNVTEELRKQGQQYDYIVDNITIGGPVYTHSANYLKPDGLYNTIAAGPNLHTLVGFFKIFLRPAWLGGVRRKAGQVLCQPKASELTDIACQFRDGKLKTSVEEIYSLEHAAAAFARLKSRRVRGKLLIKICDD